MKKQTMYMSWDRKEEIPALMINGVYVGSYYKSDLEDLIVNQIEPIFNAKGLLGVEKFITDLRPDNPLSSLVNGFEVTKYEATIQTEIKDVEAKTKPRESGWAVVSMSPIYLEDDHKLRMIRNVTLVKKGKWKGYFESKSIYDGSPVYWPYVKFLS